jgi:hypothetical protein
MAPLERKGRQKTAIQLDFPGTRDDPWKWMSIPNFHPVTAPILCHPPLKWLPLGGIGHTAVVPEKVAFLSICDQRCLDFVYLSRALTTLDNTCLRVAF